MPPSDHGSIEPHIVRDRAQRAGVWANAADITESLHEITLDFVRMDYATGDPPTRGMVVARVAFSTTPAGARAGGSQLGSATASR